MNWTAIFCFSFFALRLICAEFITNPVRDDGFGSQFQTIIYSAIYAELNHKEFRYTPFESMILPPITYNLKNDPEVLEEKENYINFKKNFKINTDRSLQNISAQEFIAFFEDNLDKCTTSQSLQKIKQIFKSDKVKPDCFTKGNLNIAVHIRRLYPNYEPFRPLSDIPDSVYLSIIDLLRKVNGNFNPKFHIYSHGDAEPFEKIYSSPDTVLHINESVEDTFTAMVFADILVTSTSSMSYAAGILSSGIIYYMPFWHPPLGHWIQLKI